MKNKGPAINDLLKVMARLRSPKGCPWDREQNHKSLRWHAVEEVYELMDAIDAGDDYELAEELGDLLLQVVFHCQLAKERGIFDFETVARRITDKLIRRHPHVFGDARGLSADAVTDLWHDIKAQENAAKAARSGRSGEAPAGALAGVPVALPALTRALKLQQKASKVGFDWNDPRAVLAKIREEADEIEAALDAGEQAHAAAEAGDLLFAVVNLARHLDADPESTLRMTNRKFERRFAWIERALAGRGKTPTQATLAEMDALWDAAKAAERAEAPA